MRYVMYRIAAFRRSFCCLIEIDMNDWRDRMNCDWSISCGCRRRSVDVRSWRRQLLLTAFSSLSSTAATGATPTTVPLPPLHLSLPLSNHIPNPKQQGWLGSQVVSVLDSGAEGPGFKSQPRRCRVTVLGKLFTPIVRHCAAKLVAALLRVAGVTAGLAESNGSLPPGLWLTSAAGWLPRTGISSGTLRSVIKYGLPLPFLKQQGTVRTYAALRVAAPR